MDMELKIVLLQKRMSLYSLSKLSGVPYMTINDIVNGVTPIRKVRFSTVLSLAHALGVTCESLSDDAPYSIPKKKDLFASSVQHRLKSQGQLPFLEEVLSKGTIDKYLGEGKLFEARYLLALIDYLCRINGLPLAKEYKYLREDGFSHPIFMGNPISEEAKAKNREEAIPEFLAGNIVEGRIDDVA